MSNWWGDFKIMREIKISQWLLEGNARQGKKVLPDWLNRLKAIVEFQYPEKWSQMSVKLFEVFLDIINLPCSSSSNFFTYPESWEAEHFGLNGNVNLALKGNYYECQTQPNMLHFQLVDMFAYMLICRTWLDFDIVNKLWSGPKRILMPLNTHSLIYSDVAIQRTGLNKHSCLIS